MTHSPLLRHAGPSYFQQVQGMRRKFSRSMDMDVTDMTEFDVVLHHLRVPELV